LPLIPRCLADNGFERTGRTHLAIARRVSAAPGRDTETTSPCPNLHHKRRGHPLPQWMASLVSRCHQVRCTAAYPPSAICHSPSAIRHLPSAISHLLSATCGYRLLRPERYLASLGVHHDGLALQLLPSRRFQKSAGGFYGQPPRSQGHQVFLILIESMPVQLYVFAMVCRRLPCESYTLTSISIF